MMVHPMNHDKFNTGLQHLSLIIKSPAQVKMGETSLLLILILKLEECHAWKAEIAVKNTPHLMHLH